MPIYDFKCTKCGYEFEEFSLVEHRDKTRKCNSCLGPACRNIKKQLQSSKVCQPDNVRFSWALGVCNPNNPEEMRIAHEVHPGAEFDGLGRMVIHNRQEKMLRMKEKSKSIGTEWVEYS
jgi:putative FmdB family regulatory protein